MKGLSNERGADTNNSGASGSFRFIISKEIYLRVVGPAKKKYIYICFLTKRLFEIAVALISD